MGQQTTALVMSSDLPRRSSRVPIESPWVCALLPFSGRPDAGVFRLGHGDGLAAPPG